jgi:electron-transferring-flavoprotein dehydrogenase
MSIERDVIDVEVLIVGAGPAGLACAYHIAAEAERRGVECPAVLVIEKGSYPGAHSLSGAVLDPRGIKTLMPDFIGRGMPFAAEAGKDSLWFMTAKSHIKMPITPPGFHNDGNYIISLNKFTSWLAEQVEARGVEIYPETGAHDLVMEDGKVVGIQTVDMGLDKKGEQKANFEPGAIIKANVVVLAEGPRGSLTKQTWEKLSIFDNAINQSYLTGVKEVWEVPEGRMSRGEIIHTFGAPLPLSEFGGGFIYSMSETMVAIGFTIGLNSPDPTNDPHRRFQQYKLHPSVKKILEGGKVLHYGAKVIPEGGYYAMPHLYDHNLLLVGDCAGFLNSLRLKGIHLGIESGMMAAETILDAFAKGDFSADTLSAMQDRFEASEAKKELHKVRNYHQGFENGIIPGMIHFALQYLTGGRGLFDRREVASDHAHVRKVTDFFTGGEKRIPSLNFDNTYTLDKLTDVYLSRTQHEEDQPPHLVISDPDLCNTRCTEEYGNPCQHFCPASVYNMVEEEEGSGRKKLELTPSNCVHCKTCDIADPYEVITWVVPEGGGGPNYENC